MKSILFFLPLVCASFAAFGETDEPALYFRTEAGPAFLQTLRADYGAGHFDVQSDIGTRFDLALGYHFTSSLSVELNSGVIWNQLRDSAQHDFYQVPIMANLVWKYPNNRFAPFLGVGAGGVDLIIVPHVANNGSTESHFVFGGQALAGVGYRLTRACELGLSYRFLGATSARFLNGSGPSFIRVGPAFTHSIQAEFTLRF